MTIMARPKKFSREGVLDKSIPVFWKYGLSGCNVQQLELATGVNKSGLYSEFASKEDLFTAALRRYLDTGPARKILDNAPSGWGNVEKFLLQAPFNRDEFTGCFAVNSTREVATLPAEAVSAINAFNQDRLDSIRKNVDAEAPKMDAGAVTDLIWTFFSGVCINANLEDDRDAHSERVASFLAVLKGL